MSAEQAGELDGLLAGVSKMLAENPELGRLAESLKAEDLSPILSMLGMGKPAPPAAPADAAPAVPAAPGSAEHAAALLSALRPFLRPDRADRVDRALRLLGAAKNVRAVLRTVGTRNAAKTP